jgi:glutaredoxin
MNMMNIFVPNDKVIVYAKSKCNYCTKAIDLLKELEIDIEYNNIETNSDPIEYNRKVNELEKITGSRTFPQIFSNGKYIGGYVDLHKKYMFDVDELLKDLKINSPRTVLSN